MMNPEWSALVSFPRWRSSEASPVDIALRKYNTVLCNIATKFRLLSRQRQHFPKVTQSIGERRLARFRVNLNRIGLSRDRGGTVPTPKGFWSRTEASGLVATSEPLTSIQSEVDIGSWINREVASQTTLL